MGMGSKLKVECGLKLIRSDSERMNRDGTSDIPFPASVCTLLWSPQASTCFASWLLFLMLFAAIATPPSKSSALPPPFALFGAPCACWPWFCLKNCLPGFMPLQLLITSPTQTLRGYEFRIVPAISARSSMISKSQIQFTQPWSAPMRTTP